MGNNENNIWPSKRNGVWRIRTYQEFMNMCREPDIISEIRKGRLRWLGKNAISKNCEESVRE
jgi:hypothetical protein